MDSGLVESLLDHSRPTFLFGCTPPSISTSSEKAAEIARKFAARGRVLAVDGYIVYDVQDESVRTEEKRPFPYRELMEPSGYAKVLREASYKDCLVYKAVTCIGGRDAFSDWMDRCTRVDGHSALNIVGAPAANASRTGPSTKEASLMAADRGVHFGAVCIAERHVSKKNEHEILFKKSSWGAQWFVTQGIYDPVPMIQVIKEYAALCKEKGIRPKKFILTFTPCGRRKTLEFIKWLGMRVPESTENRIFEEPAPPAASVDGKPARKKAVKKPVEKSCEILCECLEKILLETKDCNVPFGINIESVSGYKDEIDATHDLFRSLQAILLDHTGGPWVMEWRRVPRGPVSVPGTISKLYQRDALLTLLAGALLGGLTTGLIVSRR
uniref:Methylenetetrahydrofolate reductase (NAD(P)H) n=1 Tax=Mucochytrium quahogii TaxID=96639 RepID=A0A7S2WT39_9STRA|mmetsp:Transcript_809/g.1291  ORF Transcript_809/g.1291 Transcript_809/m.1291 type:complete len:383 (+) Transcript_809:85-1233(+)